MKIALKYGLLITTVVVVWVLLTRFLFPLAPESPANVLAPILFNVAAIAAIYLGIKARTSPKEPKPPCRCSSAIRCSCEPRLPLQT